METQGKRSISLNFGVRGWIVIIYCFISFVVGGAFLGVWQIMVAANAEVLGWNTTVIYSLTNVAGVIMCLIEILISRLMMKNRVSVARMGVIWFAIFVVACIVMKFASTNVIIFNLMFIFGYITTNGQSMCLNGSLTGNWWPKRRGMVIGITTIGVPLGSAFGNGFYNIFSAMVGADNVLFIYALIGLAVVVIGILFVRDYPEQVGAYPDNDKSENREQLEKEFEAMRAAQPKSAWNIKRILTTKQAWLIILIGFVTFNSNGIYMMQSMNRLTVYGSLDLTSAMMLMTVASVVALFGSPLCGIVDSKFGTKKCGLFILCLCLICTVLQLPGTYLPTLIGMIVFGIVMGGASNIVVSLASDAWPRESSSRAFSIIQPVMHLITMGLNECYLLLAGAVGTYFPVYIIYLCLIVFCMILFGAKYDPKKVHALDAKYKEQDALEEAQAKA